MGDEFRKFVWSKRLSDIQKYCSGFVTYIGLTFV